MNNRISVAMTTYNGSKFVQKQLESLLNQTKKPDEVIIVDDCSTDKTVEIVQKFIESNELSNWKLIKSNKNEGFIKTFNKSISETTGDIVFLCDQDDIWIETKIEIMTEIMENKNILALSSSFCKINEHDSVINERKSLTSLIYSNNKLIRRRINKSQIVNINLKEVLAYNISPGCTSVFNSRIRNEYLKIAKKQNTLPHDWAINVIASYYKGLYFFNEPLIKYRIHSSNTLGLNRKLGIEGRITECDKNLKEKKCMEGIIKKLSKNKLENDIENYINNIILSTSDRILALKSKKMINTFKLLLRYNFYKINMIESWIMDLIVLSKGK